MLTLMISHAAVAVLLIEEWERPTEIGNGLWFLGCWDILGR